MMNEWMQWHWWDWWFLGPIFILSLLFFVIIWIFIIKWGIGQHGSKNEESALDILKKRYASGEISKEEFEEKKREIL